MQPQLAKAHQQSGIPIRNDFKIVSIVKGMTFVLIELDSLEALGLVAVAGQSLVVDGLDEGWDQSFVGTYFFVRTGESTEGRPTLRTRMIEGTLEDPATGSAGSALAAYLSLTEGKPEELLEYKIIQGVEMGRQSEILIDVIMAGDMTVSKLYLQGGAVEVMQGRLTV